MTEPADLELLRAHVNGDKTAFTTLSARHERWIFNAARRRLGDDHLADDARQAVLLLLAEKAETLVQSNTPSVSAWLFHVMHFTCSTLRRTRSRQTHHEIVAGELSQDRPPTTDESLLAMLEDVIAQLDPRDREAVVRRFYQRESFAVVGEALGISAEAARKRVSRVLAHCRASMTIESVDARPESLLNQNPPPGDAKSHVRSGQHQTIEALARRTMTMVQQMEAIRFAVMTAEFYVRSVEDNLDFFEKLGFRRHFVETPDTNGHAPRASLRGGHARLWLRRATPDNPPTPGITLYVWLDGGEPAVLRHREAIAAQGVAVNQFFYDGALMNFTVTTPDGYTIGFFSTYKPHTFDPALDG